MFYKRRIGDFVNSISVIAFCSADLAIGQKTHDQKERASSLLSGLPEADCAFELVRKTVELGEDFCQHKCVFLTEEGAAGVPLFPKPTLVHAPSFFFHRLDECLGFQIKGLM